MSGKIMGANYDDLAKLMGADLIVLGDAVVGEVKTGSTFYAGSTVLLTGSGTQTLDPGNENVPAGYYVATTLSAVDGDLAAGNIKKDVVIFGFTGTVEPVEDNLGTGVSATSTYSSGTFYRKSLSIAAESDYGLPATATIVFSALSLAVGSAFAYIVAGTASTLKLRLYMGGVQVAESSFISAIDTEWKIVVGTRALVGSQDVDANVHNYDVSPRTMLFYSKSSTSKRYGFAVSVGSVKI